MVGRLRTAVPLLLLVALFFYALIISLGGDSDAEPMQWLMGVLTGLCLIGAVAALVWPRRG